MRNCGDKGPFFRLPDDSWEKRKDYATHATGSELRMHHTFRKLNGLLGHGIRQAEAGNNTIEIDLWIRKATVRTDAPSPRK